MFHLNIWSSFPFFSLAFLFQTCSLPTTHYNDLPPGRHIVVPWPDGTYNLPSECGVYPWDPVGRGEGNPIKCLNHFMEEQALIWCLCSSLYLPKANPFTFLDEHHFSSFWMCSLVFLVTSCTGEMKLLLHHSSQQCSLNCSCCTKLPVQFSLYLPSLPSQSPCFLNPLVSDCGQHQGSPTLAENTLDLMARMQTKHSLGSHSGPNAM